MHFSRTISITVCAIVGTNSLPAPHQSEGEGKPSTSTVVRLSPPPFFPKNHFQFLIPWSSNEPVPFHPTDLSRYCYKLLLHGRARAELCARIRPRLGMQPAESFAVWTAGMGWVFPSAFSLDLPYLFLIFIPGMFRLTGCANRASDLHGS